MLYIKYINKIIQHFGQQPARRKKTKKVSIVYQQTGFFYSYAKYRGFDSKQGVSILRKKEWEYRTFCPALLGSNKGTKKKPDIRKKKKGKKERKRRNGNRKYEKLYSIKLSPPLFGYFAFLLQAAHSRIYIQHIDPRQLTKRRARVGSSRYSIPFRVPPCSRTE